MDMLLVTPEEKKKIHEYYNVDEKQIKEDIELIKTWKENNLTTNLERVIIVKLRDIDPNHYELVDIVRGTIILKQISLLYDNRVAIRAIFDAEGISLTHVIKWNRLIITKFNTLVEKAYSCRIAGLECLNFPSFANKIMKIFKPALRPNLYEKIGIHENLESLYKVVPKDYMSFSLEHLHPVEMRDEQHGAFGVDGTFKQLTID
ncbi:hypothetical protein MTP99_018688 [Tenebrio molitor]|nr:hypothetical protein MTP99_018688 [Tenebrio molitor]